jgi:MFS family permease
VHSLSIGGRSLSLAGESKFRRLSITHAAMMAGDGAMVVALADSKFLSISPEEGREQVLLFLVVSFAPFLLIAPLIGPFLDRIAGGRRTVIQIVACSRVVLSVLMAFLVDDLALFPLVFVALVLQKTYLISKSAIVPSVVRTERELIEANSKLGMIAGLVGFVAVIPAALIQLTLGSTVTLIYAALVFSYCLFASTFLEADVVAREQPAEAEIVELQSQSVVAGAFVMMMLRAVVGFMLFLMAFWLRSQSAGTAKFGLALSTAAIATVIGNASASRLRRLLSEERMLLAALVMSGTAGFAAAAIGNISAMIALAFFANLAASIGRLGFEAMLQRDAPDANRGRAFAGFETRFQLSWAAAGLIAVVVEMSGPTGALVIGLACLLGIAYTLVRPRLDGPPTAVATRRIRTVVGRRLRRRADADTG